MIAGKRWRTIRLPDARAVRLCSGLVLFTYVSLHLLNHSLGNISLGWMERGLLVHKFIWQGVFGTFALYTALTLHFILGLSALYSRRLHWTPAEFAQLLLGLCVPPLLANHLAGTRVAFAQFGLNKGYAQVLYSFWIASPGFGRIQLTLLIVAWTHGCLGLCFWLRLKPWFDRCRSWLLAAAVLVPTLALLGYLQGGREVVALARDPAWRAAATAPAITGTPVENLWLANLRNAFLLFDGTALVLILIARLVRSLHDRYKGRIRVTYPDGRQQWIPLGFTVLEASRLAGIPHAGLCGGRGRCSLCRVRVLGGGPLPPPEESEQRVLAQLGANPSTVRLACQLRPTHDIAVFLLVPANAQLAFLHRRQRRVVSEERFVVFLIVDMRDSTTLAATRLPYDSVFVLGRFISAVSSGLVQAGGLPNQFLGDGVLAIFGLDTNGRVACRQGLAALQGIARNVRWLNGVLRDQLDGPIRFGMGLHCGRAVVGEIGFQDHVTFTAIGDPLNVTSRLQDLSKDLGCEAVVSENVLVEAGLAASALPSHLARLRGRGDPVACRLLHRIERDMAAAGWTAELGLVSV